MGSDGGSVQMGGFRWVVCSDGFVQMGAVFRLVGSDGFVQMVNAI